MNWKDWENENQVAFDFMPIVIHGIRDKWKDQISSIYFGDLIKSELEPFVYYEIVDYHHYKVIVYQFFHRLDWSMNKCFIVAKLDSHHLDFEGCLKCVSNEGEVLWTATRSHYNMIFQEGDSRVIYIEPESHSIRPSTGERHWDNQIVLSKDQFKYVNVKRHWKHFEKHIYPVFRRFHIDQWRQWHDKRIEHKFGRVRCAGLLNRDPMKFYKYAKACNIVSKGE